MGACLEDIRCAYDRHSVDEPRREGGERKCRKCEAPALRPFDEHEVIDFVARNRHEGLSAQLGFEMQRRATI